MFKIGYLAARLGALFWIGLLLVVSGALGLHVMQTDRTLQSSPFIPAVPYLIYLGMLVLGIVIGLYGIYREIVRGGRS